MINPGLLQGVKKRDREEGVDADYAALLSVNVGLPRKVSYRGRDYETAIYKDPQPGRVALSTVNLEGDAQGNPKTHGGPDMAVYVYSRDHYVFWEKDLGAARLPYGSFGENFTVTGMREDAVHIGDVFRIGSARFQVTEPRTPCHKLAMKFDDIHLPRRFLESGRVGFYLRVLDTGDVGAGDEVALEARDPARLSIAETLATWFDKGADMARLERALSVAALSGSWRAGFEKRLQAAETTKSDPRTWDTERLTWV